MGPPMIFAMNVAARQGGPDLGLVALVAVVALALVACQGLLTELVRSLVAFTMRTKDIDVDVRFKDDHNESPTAS